MSEAREASVSGLIRATPAGVFRAFVEPRLLASWLAPEGMRGEVHELEPHEGGEFWMSLTYETDEGRGTGKSTPDRDTFRGRFAILQPGECVKLAGGFETDDPAFATEMSVTFSFVEVPGGTVVTALTSDIPEGVSLADNEAGSRSSLENLRRLVEA